MSGGTGAPTHLIGLWRGREVDTDATVSFTSGSLVFAGADGRLLRVRLEVLDGCRLDGLRATLYATGGDVLEVAISADEARAVLRAALDAATRVPELTRSLRFVGRSTANHDAAHDRWFGPLLARRRAIVGISDPLRQLAQFDVDGLQAELERALLELSAQRTGGDAPRARALEALLEEQTEGVRTALGRVALATTALQGSDADSRLADWRVWIGAVRVLFRDADDAWPSLQETLQRGP